VRTSRTYRLRTHGLDYGRSSRTPIPCRTTDTPSASTTSRSRPRRAAPLIGAGSGFSSRVWRWRARRRRSLITPRAIARRSSMTPTASNSRSYTSRREQRQRPPSSEEIRPVRKGQYGPRSMRLLVARCEVLYTGRLTARLPEAVRLLMFKADGSFLVHDDAGGFRPLNWIR
jgi:Endonuclease NucS N-terminal PH-like domain